MSEIVIRSVDGRSAFEPGELMHFSVQWQGSKTPERAEARLVWYTEGKGDRDLSVLSKQRLASPQPQDSREITFEAPAAPHSFSGRLITLQWAIEVLHDGGKESARLDLVIAPDRREIDLTAHSV